jgi:hypothetical protein
VAGSLQQTLVNTSNYVFSRLTEKVYVVLQRICARGRKSPEEEESKIGS